MSELDSLLDRLETRAYSAKRTTVLLGAPSWIRGGKAAEWDFAAEARRGTFLVRALHGGPRAPQPGLSCALRTETTRVALLGRDSRLVVVVA